MIDDDRFQTRYAIRMPDGRLAMNSITGSPWIWVERADAEKAMGYFRAYAERLGVEDWHGQIVQQLCTPWVTECDYITAQQFVDELTLWLEQQTGGAA